MSETDSSLSAWEVLRKEVTQALSSNSSKDKIDLIILCVDDEPDMLEIIKDDLDDFTGIEILTATSAQEALNTIRKSHSKIALVMSDFNMPEINGFELRSEMLKISGSIPFLVLSGFVDKEMALKGIEQKISGFLRKPFNKEEFATVISKDLKSRIDSIKEEQELLIGFIGETRALLEDIETHTLELEEAPNNKDLVNSIFGMLHTIKGPSGFFEPKTLHHYTHRFEEVLKKLQNDSLQVTPKVISTILKAIDISKALLKELESGMHSEHNLDELSKPFSDSELKQTTEQVSAAAKEEGKSPGYSPVEKDKSIKVELDLLDEFLRASGEMTVVRNMLNKAVSTIEKKYSADKDVLNLSELLEELHKVNALVQNKITEVRKVHLKNIFKPLPRVIRDTSAKVKKSIAFEIQGEELRVDSSIAEVLNASLTHMIRNSIDHGIESAEERKTLGKPDKGKISIHAYFKNECVFIDVRDDGKGINTDAIRKKLLSNGLSESEVAKMKESDLHMVIFDSGFSTAAQTTDISGRGVGTSAVKASVESIGGKIRIETQKGLGTCFTLELPVPKSVHIKNCLFVIAQGKEFGIAQDQILRLVNIDDSNKGKLICNLEGGSVLRLEDGAVIPLVSLAKSLLLSDQSALPSQFKVVILRTEAGKNYGLVVDEIRDFEDAVVKELTPIVRKVGVYSGATFLSDGTVGLLLNVDGIAKAAELTQEKSKVNSKDSQFDIMADDSASSTDWLLFALSAGGTYAVPRESVFRIEEFEVKAMQKSGRWHVSPYRNQVLPILNLNLLLDSSVTQDEVHEDGNSRAQVLVINHKNKLLGFRVKNIIDIISSNRKLEDCVVRVKGVRGNVIIDAQTITVIDPIELLLNSYQKGTFLDQEDRQPILAA